MYIYLLIELRRRATFNIVKLAYFAVVLALLSSSAYAEDWTTSDGMKYQDVQVLHVYDDAITIIYKDGGALVPINKLPVPLQKKYNYDPAKAKIAADARAKADAESAKQLQAEIEMSDKMKRAQAIKDAQAAGFSTNAAK